MARIILKKRESRIHSESATTPLLFSLIISVIRDIRGSNCSFYDSEKPARVLHPCDCY